MDEGFKKYLRNLFTRPKSEPILPAEPKELLIRSREPNPDELALGWAEGENEANGQTIAQLKGVPQEHRDAHFYVVGATRSGKTKFLETLIEQDIKNGFGFGVLDPHGDLTENIKGYLYILKKESPEFFQERVILIDPTDKNFSVTFNPLERTHGESAARTRLSLRHGRRTKR